MSFLSLSDLCRAVTPPRNPSRSRSQPAIWFQLVKIWVTSLRSRFSRRLSAVAFGEADLTARCELRLASPTMVKCRRRLSIPSSL